MKSFHKQSTPQLSAEEAGRILEQVLESGGMENNSVPLEALLSGGGYRKTCFNLRRIIPAAVAGILLFLLICFIPCSFVIEEDNTRGRTYNPIYRMEVESFMLVERVNAAIDGYNIPVYEMGPHIYSIEPTRNGQMSVTVTLLNGQTMTQYVEVTAVDREVPTVLSCAREGDLFYLYLFDGKSGVDFSKTEAMNQDGRKVDPASVDEERGCIVFSAAEDTLNVCVADMAGNRLHLILTAG